MVLPVPAGPVPGGFGDQNSNGWLVQVAHGLGYVPFVEARAVESGRKIYDDYRTSQGVQGLFSGEKCWAFDNVIKLNTWASTDWAQTPAPHTSTSVGFIIYRLPVST